MYRTRGKDKKNKQTQTIDTNPRRSSLQVNLSYTFDLSDSESADSSQNPVNKNSDYKNSTTTSINNDVSRVLANIKDKDEALSRNCSRLRDAILNKTKELFDKNNDLCQITTKVMESPLDLTNEQCKLKLNSPILHSSRNCDAMKLSPRRTRAFSKRESLNNSLASSSQISNNNGLVQEITNIGSPIICSTFIDHCNIHESCNIKKIIRNPVEDSVTDVNIPPDQTVPTFGIKVIQEATPANSKARPSVRNVQMCKVLLDRFDGFQLLDKSKIVQEVSMDLTETQGNCILNKSQLRNKRDEKPSGIATVEKSCTIPKVHEFHHNLSAVIEDVTNSECMTPNVSMSVNTSLIQLTDEEKKLDDQTGQVSCQQNVVQANSTNANVIRNKDDELINLLNDCNDYEDDVSLVKRLRVISRKNCEESVIPTRKSINESPGVVEGTPFPMTRSMLLRTQVKSSLEDKTKSPSCPNISESKNHLAGPSKAIDTVGLEKTILLDSTPFRSENQAAVRIDESFNDELIRILVPNNNDRPIARKLPIGKRKLFTHHDSSEPASFSPVSNDVYSPQVSKLKRVKRRRIRRNVAGRIIKPQSIIGKSQRHTLTQIVITSSSASSQDYEKIRDIERDRKKKRAIKSKKIVVRKPLKPSLLNVINEVRDKTFDEDLQTSRRSNIFQTKKRVPIKRNYGNQRIIIVTTGLCNGDKEVVKEAVKKLKGATMELSVTKKTTHVVTTGVRTINLLRGIIRGCWLVKFDWIKESIKAEKWLPAENFEIDHFSKAVAENRRDREIFGNSYVPDLFATCGLIYVQSGTTPPCEILKELIKIAGGSIIEDPKKSKITIGRDGIKENWVLDSITTGELQSIGSYKRKKSREK